MMIAERALADDPRPRVLLADDNAEMRSFIRRLLSDRYEVEMVADGRAALESLQRRRPSLVLTDLVMPHVDGLALLKAIRSDASLRTLPVIVLTERGEVDSRIEGPRGRRRRLSRQAVQSTRALARVRANLELARMREAVERANGREEALRESNRRKDDSSLHARSRASQSAGAARRTGSICWGCPTPIPKCSPARERC